MTIAISRISKLLTAGPAPSVSWRKLVPSPFRLAYRLVLSIAKDIRSGVWLKIAVPRSVAPPMHHSIQLAQPVLANAWTQNKLHNFRLAAQRINAVTVMPGEVFSFWKTLGNPTAKRGYRPGRNLLNGQVQETIGGGLCQVSGILYHLSLLAGLDVLERHNHSIDLYANGEQRFTPLGADATVAFGYKDLRVGNPFGFAVRFELVVREAALVCHLHSEKQLAQHAIEFQCADTANGVRATALKRLADGSLEVLHHSDYRIFGPTHRVT